MNTANYFYRFIVLVKPHATHNDPDLFKDADKSHFHRDKFVWRMIGSNKANINRTGRGFRYNEELKMYCAYIRMLGGRLAYETLKANATHSIPNLSSIDRYIGRSKSNAEEGVLRTDELAKYLQDLNLPRIVLLSEDATRIVNRIQYDKGTNKLVGFVLPIQDSNGMPFTGRNDASSAAAIERCFFDVKTGGEKKRSSNVNVVMAQPLARGIPAFCLLIFGTDSMYNSEDIRKRWNFIVDELRKRDIEVLSFSSDSDPKFNSVMRQHLKLGQKTQITSSLPEYFNADFPSSMGHSYVPVQDTVHIGTKFRNRIINKTLKFGEYDVSINHVMTLIEMFSKDKHKLCASTVKPTDRMNFDSVLKICDESVISLLRNVDGSEGTVLYLEMTSKVLRSFLDLRLTPLERIRYIWFANTILRIWKDDMQSTGKYKLKEHYPTLNSVSCVEINSHSLVILMCLLKERNLDHLFHPELIGSQQCESIFRQIRSLSSSYSTVTNANLLEIIQRISKIELQNEIAHIKLTNFNFPRIGKTSSSYYPLIDRNGEEKYLNFTPLPSRDEIFHEIELAQMEAFEYAEGLGVSIKNPSNYVCKAREFENFKKSATIDISLVIENNFDPDILQLFKEINLRQYSTKIKADNIDEKSVYVKVKNIHGDSYCVKKNTLCWLLDKTTTKLSSDRLIKFMNKLRKTNNTRTAKIKKKKR